MIDDKLEEFFLLKMLPEQISDKWEEFAPLIEMSLPPAVNRRRQRMANVLRSILLEELEVWCYWDKQKSLRYVVSTYVQVEPVSLSRDLLIYSFTSLGSLDIQELVRGFEVLKKYAESRGCYAILAYVDDARVMQVLERIGGKGNFTLMQMEV